MRRTPTLLVFTLGAVRDSARRGLLPARLRPLEVEARERFLAAALEAGRDCGCRLEVCSPAPLALPVGAVPVRQAAGGFGSRLETALAESFDRGAGPLLVVGADVPGLSASHLGRALELLAGDPDRVVLGPSPDGGLYLLAAGRPLPADWAGAVRWCRRDTLRTLLRLLRAAGRPVTLLAPLADLDRPADLERWLARVPGDLWRSLAGRLRLALAGLRRPPAGSSARTQPGRAPLADGRAPPLPASA